MFKKALDEILAGNDLSTELAEEAVVCLLKGEIDEIRQAGFLTALKMKGETAEEVASFARTMRRLAQPVATNGFEVIDLAGTGGDGKSTFNVSTAVAFVISGAGAKVAKHGNHGVSGPVGSADVLEALGIPCNVEKTLAEECLQEHGLVFLYAPRFQPATGNVAKVRKSLGFRTIFNILGPITNPAAPTSQLMGIYDYKLAPTAARVLVELGAKRVMVVHSTDGMDEISTFVPTKVCEIYEGKESQYEIDPREYGFTKQRGLYTVKNSAESAKMIKAVMQGEETVARDMVLLNAGAALYIYGLASDIKEGVKMAQESIASGAAAQKLLSMQAWGEKIKRLALESTKVS